MVVVWKQESGMSFPRSLNGNSDRLTTVSFGPFSFPPFVPHLPSSCSCLNMGTDTGGIDLLASHHPYHYPRNDANDRTDDDTDAHDLDIHFSSCMGSTIPVSTSCQTNLYYSSFSDSPCNPFPDNLASFDSYPYSLQDGHLQEGHLDPNYILVSEIQNPSNPTFIHDSPQLMPKPFHSTHDLPSAGPSPDLDSPYQSSPSSCSSISYISTVQDLTSSSNNLATRFSGPQKPSGHAHTMLPPIVQSNPADLARNETDVSPLLLYHIYSRADSAIEPCGQQAHKRRVVLPGGSLRRGILAGAAWRGEVEHFFCSPL